MNLSKHYPIPNDRMGFLWTLTSIEDCCVVEFGPAGTTHFAIEGVMEMNAEHRMAVYTTHINDVDITFGRHDKLVGAIKEVDAQQAPKFIFVMASSVTSLIGIDIESICEECQPAVNARLIPVPYGGYDGDYTLGVERCLTMLVRHVMKDTTKRPGTYNILGSNLDSYRFLSDSTEIRRILKGAFDLNCHTVLTAYTGIDAIQAAPCADFNLVIRREGIPAAELMRERFGIPYFYGMPYGLEGTLDWLTGLAETFSLLPDMDFLRAETAEAQEPLKTFRMSTRGVQSRRVVLYGNYERVAGLAKFMTEAGLEATDRFVNHRPATGDTEVEGFRYHPDELMLSQALDSPYFAAFGDYTLKSLCGGRKFIYASNPQPEYTDFYPYTPMAGFHGVMLFTQELLNLLRK